MLHKYKIIKQSIQLLVDIVSYNNMAGFEPKKDCKYLTTNINDPWRLV